MEVYHCRGYHIQLESALIRRINGYTEGGAHDDEACGYLFGLPLFERTVLLSTL